MLLPLFDLSESSLKLNVQWPFFLVLFLNSKLEVWKLTRGCKCYWCEKEWQAQAEKENVDHLEGVQVEVSRSESEHLEQPQSTEVQGELTKQSMSMVIELPPTSRS